MEKSIYRSICYYGLPDEDYLFVSFDDFTVLYIEARTARTLRPSVALSLPSPPLTTLGCVWRRRPRHARCAAAACRPAKRPRREVCPFAAAPPPACILPCVAARFATQVASVRATMQAGTRSMHNARGETGGAEPAVLSLSEMRRLQYSSRPSRENAGTRAAILGAATPAPPPGT